MKDQLDLLTSTGQIFHHPAVSAMQARSWVRTHGTLWTQALFVIYTILAYCALAAYGGAILSTLLLPRWMGWLAIVYGLAGLGLLGFTGDVPPFLYYLLPMAIGIFLLLRRSQVPTRSHQEEESIVAETRGL